MAKNLVIVESPAKAKTIARFLGSDFTVKSSYGHVRDLPKKEMGVDIEHNFAPQYVQATGKQPAVKELKQALKSAETVWLATDEDREGEAIAWHLAKLLKLDEAATKRIAFHEITEPAIKAAVANPRTLNKHLVDAQQARRVLDRLVGYELSPLLWKKVRQGLSAGRVQSVAVRLLVERERAIRGFSPTRDWRVMANFEAAGQSFAAELATRLPGETQAKALVEAAVDAKFSVSKLATTPGTKNPSPPFTTSTLQQTASSVLGYSVKQTMVVAQKLYEAGLITYMRTDSLALSDTAIKQAAALIRQEFGEPYLNTRQFKTKSRLAQEAHEAIRPTNLSVRSASDGGWQKLYDLIWKRTLASQMTAATIEKTVATIDMSGRADTFTATGQMVKFEGFLKVYAKALAAQDKLLPPLKESEQLKLIDLVATETLTKPKPRYTEASLVKKLEALGIGRPSTYAPTISTIQDRGYVERRENPGKAYPIKVLKLAAGQVSEATEDSLVGNDRGKLTPTEIGEVVVDFLVKYFADIVDYQFTAKVEDEFDAIAAGKEAWQTMLKQFYPPFHRAVVASEKIPRQEVTQARELGKDPKTGRPVFARIGRYGPIIQLGEAEDDVKPKFLPIPKAQRYDEISFAEALELLSLPRELGKTAAGDIVTADIGPYGPYLRAGKLTVSLKEHDPLKVELPAALELIAAKAEQQANKVIAEFKDSKLQVLNGPYGPYVSDGKRNAPVPKTEDPAKLSQTQAEELLANRPAKRRRYR